MSYLKNMIVLIAEVRTVLQFCTSNQRVKGFFSVLFFFEIAISQSGKPENQRFLLEIKETKQFEKKTEVVARFHPFFARYTTIAMMKFPPSPCPISRSNYGKKGRKNDMVELDCGGDFS